MIQYARQAWQTLRAYLTQRSISSSDLDRLFNAPPVLAGVSVTEDTALNYSAVWQAVQVISGSIASLPLKLYKRHADGGREEFSDHPLYGILHDAPNAEMTSMSFRQTLQQHVLLWGNGYAEIQRDSANRVTALWPIVPNRVTQRRDPGTRGKLYYQVMNDPGRSPARIEMENMFHLVGLSWDGVNGYSVVGRARQSIGLGIAAEAFGSTFFGNGTVLSGFLKHPGRMSQLAHDKLRADFEARHQGPGKAHRMAILEENMEWHSMGIPPQDAQFLETRVFQVQEICRWFNLPPHKLRENTHSTFTNIEHEALSFVRDTLRPWLVAWEQEVKRKLIAPLERRIQYAEHLTAGLERGDIAARQAYYATLRNWGALKANTICDLENLPRLPGDQGEMYLVPANMIPADQVGKLLESQNVLPVPVEPTTENEPEDAEEPEDGEEEEAPARHVTVADVATTNGHANGHAPRRRAQLITAQRVMMTDVVRRNLAREKDKARTTATHGPDRLRMWIGEFYGPYADVFARALLPAVQMHLALTESDDDPETMTRDLVAAHVGESQRQLRAMLDAPPADLRAAVDELMTRWDVERVQTIPDALMVQEIAHAG